jgi:hypothetical protein
MDVKLRYRGREVTEADAIFIRQLIVDHPTASRRALSKKLCLAWNWLQPNGAPRDMVCRGLMLAGDWERIYGHPVYFAETFVDPQRHRGTCYRAANWTLMGLTTGRGKDDQTGRPNRSIKQVLGYPLCRNFRSLLSRVP